MEKPEHSTTATTQPIVNSESSNKPNNRHRRSVSSDPQTVEPAATSSNDRSTVPLCHLTSTNTNAVLSDARAKAQFVALNVGKAVSQHISQLEMNNEGQYNVWVSNTSMNKNYSSESISSF